MGGFKIAIDVVHLTVEPLPELKNKFGDYKGDIGVLI